MKNFTKKLLIFCGIYAITQIPNYNSVFAAENVDNHLLKSSTVEVTNLTNKSSTKVDELNIKDMTKPTNIANNESTIKKQSTVPNLDEEAKVTNYKSGNEDSTQSIFVKYDIPVNKKWEIKFSQPINPESLRGKIKIIDKKTDKEVPVNLSLEKNDTSVIVSYVNKYNPESDYSLIIEKNILSKYNKELKNPALLEFKTTASIDSINNIDIAINQEEEFYLPSKVNAIMSNAKLLPLDVTWDKTLKNTSIPGTYTYYGTVNGYDQKVILTLNIKPFEPVKSISNEKRSQSSVQVNTYNYLMNYDNRESVMRRAIELHNGELSNNCVYFSSEALRRGGLTSLPNYVANTRTLTSKLENMGWKSSTDLSTLLPGDVCFTTSYGYGPTHAYIFMKWVDPDKRDYAYICDNQGSEYGNIYHKRNISFATVEKDAISYFMYLP